MIFTQFSILDLFSPDTDGNRSQFVKQRRERIELHLGAGQPVSLGLSTDLKTVRFHYCDGLNSLK